MRRRATLLSGPTEASADFYQQILKYVGLLATIAVVVMVTRMARRALREAEQSQEGSAVTGKPHLDPNYKPTSYEAMMIVEAKRMTRRLIENCRPPVGQSAHLRAQYNWLSSAQERPGLVSAGGAAKLGAKVALIERNLMGGDCLNVGCVPSKGIIRAARAVIRLTKRCRVWRTSRIHSPR